MNPKDFAFGDAGDGFTFGGVQSRGDLDFDIFGDVFLKSVYVVCEYRWREFYPHHHHVADMVRACLPVNQGESTVGLAQRDD